LIIVEMLRRINAPIKNPELRWRPNSARLVQQSLAAAAPGVAPVAGAVGVIANPNANPGVTNGGSVAQGAAPGRRQPATARSGSSSPRCSTSPVREHIDLSDADDFVANLPASHHYSDKTIRALMMQLRRLWLGYYRNMYPEVAEHVSSTKLDMNDLELTDEQQQYEGRIVYMMFANGNSKRDEAKRVTKAMADKAARALLASWAADSEKLKELQDKSAVILRKMMARQFELTKRETNIPSDFDSKVDDMEEWLDRQTGRLIRLTQSTVRDELRAFIADQITEGYSSADIADNIRAHFTGFEGHKADRVARSETRDAVNAATLLNGEAAGIRYTRATDGEMFDKECADRNGKLFTVKEAWREIRKEHPYGTLGFKLIPRIQFSVETVKVLPDAAGEDPDTTAWFDATSQTAFMLMDQPEDDKEEFLRAVGDLVMS
jgi:hypothetical protein